MTKALILDQIRRTAAENDGVPVEAEYLLKKRADSNFPNQKAFERFGSKAQLVAKVIAYCQTRGGLEGVVAICGPLARADQLATDNDASDDAEYGFVYLLKSGRFYKIGRSNVSYSHGSLFHLAGFLDRW